MLGSMETLIGKDCETKGNIYSKGNIRIDGKIEGNIQSEENVIMGENASIKGNVYGKHLTIGGKIIGDVTAKAKLEILNTGKIYGDIKTPRLIMAEGVIFEGNCEMEKIIEETTPKK